MFCISQCSDAKQYLSSIYSNHSNQTMWEIPGNFPNVRKQSPQCEIPDYHHSNCGKFLRTFQLSPIDTMIICRAAASQTWTNQSKYMVNIPCEPPGPLNRYKVNLRQVRLVGKAWGSLEQTHETIISPVPCFRTNT